MKYLRLIFSFLIVFFVISCTKKSNDPDISFSEQSLANDVLATVSMLNDSVYLVGGENGEIYLLNSSNDSVVGNDKPDLARIYCLYADGDTFYAGVRNSGIVKLVRENKKLKIVKQQYKIPHKGTNYSPYNIIPYRENTLIAMTSNGLYYFSNDTSDVLYPIPYGPDSGTPFSYCSPISIGDDIYVGTTKGIVKINSKHGKPVVVDSCRVNKAICKVVKENDNTIYALSECHGNDTLYTINIKDNKFDRIDTCGLDFSALSFVKAEDKFYFVNEHNLYVISNLDNMNNSQKEGNSVVIKLPHEPLSDARNLIAYDKRAKKIRIITQKALLSLPSVNSIGQSKGQICGISYDERNNKVYFQNTKKEVFEYENGQASKSKFVKFDPTEEISSFSAFDNTLFYISNHEQVKSKKTGFLQFHSNRPYNLPKKSTAMMLVDDSVIYVGIRDSLLRINLTDNRMESLIKDIEPYVTKLKKHGDSIVVSTLNDGLIFLHDGYSRKTVFEDVHFQNDYMFTSENKKNNSILLLNNHYLRFYTNSILQDSVPLRGYERLLFSPQKQVGVAVKRSGVQYFKLENNENRKEIKLLCNESRPISPDGCMIINDTLFLAADEGMLKTPLTEDKLPDYVPVNFDSSDIDVTKTVICIGGVIVFLLFVSIILLWSGHQKEKKRREGDYRLRVQSLIEPLDYIEDEGIKNSVRQLEKKIIVNRGIVFDDELNKQIQNTAQQVAIGLVEVIKEKQIPKIESIGWAECENIKEKCLKCIARKNTTELLERVKDNKKFLEEASSINKQLGIYDEIANNVMKIEGVTSDMCDKIAEVKKALSEDSLKIANAKLDNLNKNREELNSKENVGRINAFVENLSKNSSSGNNKFEDYVSNKLESIKKRLNSSPSRDTIESVLTEIKGISIPCSIRNLLSDLYEKVQELLELETKKENLKSAYDKNEKEYKEPLSNHEKGIKRLRPEDRHRLLELKKANDDIEKEKKDKEKKISDIEEYRDKAIKDFYGYLSSENINLIKRLLNLKRNLTIDSDLCKLLIMIMAIPRGNCRYQQYTKILYSSLSSDSSKLSSDMSHIKRYILDFFNEDNDWVTADDKARNIPIYKLLQDCREKVRE